MKVLTIGKVAAKAGVTTETIRYYERQGLIVMPPRGSSGYREYPQEVFTRILFIRGAKKLGFTLTEIKDLLSLQSQPSAKCGDIRERARDKMASLEKEIAKLQKARTDLSELVAACVDESQPADHCNILKFLNTEKTL